MGSVRRVVVVGAGTSGLMTALALAEARVPVDLLSLVPAKRSPSVTLEDGINAATDRGGDGPRVHLEDTLAHGGFLANQAPVLGMVEAAPAILDLLDRMGVPFDRTNEGLIEQRASRGSKHARTAFAGGSTGQQILYALDEQVRRLEDQLVSDDDGAPIPGEKLIRRFERWEIVALVRDGRGHAVGAVAQDLKTMRVRAFPGDAVVLATGGFGALYGRTTASALSTGAAAAVALRSGAAFANADLVQVHPMTLAGGHARVRISERVLRDGGRLWVPRDVRETRAGRDVPEADRDYILERLASDAGKEVAADVAAGAMFRACIDEGLGVFDPEAGQNARAVYVDLTPAASGKDDAAWRMRVGGALAKVRKLSGVDPHSDPIKVFPAVAHTLGGIWVDFERTPGGSLDRGSARNHATTIPGLYAVGDVQYQYHGAKRLDGNGALACLYGAMLTVPAVLAYRSALGARVAELPRSIFDKAEKAADEAYARLLRQNEGNGDAENAYVVADELRDAMFQHATIDRSEAGLTRLAEKLEELDARAKKVRVADTSPNLNQSAPFARQLEHMLVLARVVAASARERLQRSTAEAPLGETILAVHGDAGDVRLVRELSYGAEGGSVTVTSEVDRSIVAPEA